MSDYARRERINEIYRSVWHPLPEPGGGLPLTPDDHVLHARKLVVELGIAIRDLPVFRTVAGERGEEIATEYVWLLLAEATGAEEAATE